MSILKTENLTYIYGSGTPFERKAVDDVSLEIEKGGDIARNLMSLYVFFNEELMDATISHNKQKIEFVLKMTDELTESWRIIANSTANAPAAKVANALNIVG